MKVGTLVAYAGTVGVGVNYLRQNKPYGHILCLFYSW